MVKVELLICSNFSKFQLADLPFECYMITHFIVLCYEAPMTKIESGVVPH